MASYRRPPRRIRQGVLFQEEDRSKGIDIIDRSEAYMTSIRGDSVSFFQEASTSLTPC
jgi:ABC-type dipeptide/oligopeptide/nickel transport system ATPase component